jgi:hypothetical protein
MDKPSGGPQTAGDLKEITTELEKRHKTRVEQQELDEKIWRLEKYVLQEVKDTAREKNYPTFTGNDPRNFTDVIVWSLNRYRIEWRGDVYEVLRDAAKKDEISAHERFAQGVCREIDELRSRRVEMPLQHDVAWFNAIRGGCVLRPWVIKAGAGVTPFRADLWDPMECVWDVGQNGLSFFGHHYLAGVKDLRQSWDEWDADIKGDENGNAEVFDCWWLDEDGRVWNSVSTASNVELKEFTDHSDRVDHIPVIIKRSSGAPVGPRMHNKSQNYLTDQWDSILAPNREMYAAYNRVVTLFMLCVRNGAIGPWVFDWGPDGSALSAEEIRKSLEPFGFLQGRNIKLEAAVPPEVSKSAQQLEALVGGHLQRGSVPQTIYGQTPYELTGIAISQLQGALDLKIVGQKNTMCDLHREMMDEFIQQFIKVRRKVTVKGLDRRGKPFMDEITSQQLRTKYYLAANLRIDLPITRQQEANIASMWQKLGVPLEIIFDELLHLQDPSAAYQLKLAEAADAEPAVLDMRRVFYLDKMADAQDGTTDAGRRMQELYLGMRDFFAQRIAATQAQPAGAAGAGMPPEILSPEMAGEMEQHLQPFTRGPQHLPGYPAGPAQEAGRLARVGLVGPRG